VPIPPQISIATQSRLENVLVADERTLYGPEDLTDGRRPLSSLYAHLGQDGRGLVIDPGGLNSCLALPSEGESGAVVRPEGSAEEIDKVL
jgi:hypothetical protein